MLTIPFPEIVEYAGVSDTHQVWLVISANRKKGGVDLKGKEASLEIGIRKKSGTF